MSCGVGCTCGSDPVLLWLWCRPVATAPIRLLAWEIHMPWEWPKKWQKDKKNINTHFKKKTINLYSPKMSKWLLEFLDIYSQLLPFVDKQQSLKIDKLLIHAIDGKSEGNNKDIKIVL